MIRANRCNIPVILWWLVLGALSDRVRAQQGESPAPPSPGLPVALPVPSRSSSEDEMIGRLRKLEVLNQAILNRLDESEREKQRTNDRYHALEAKYEALQKRLEAPSWRESVAADAREPAPVEGEPSTTDRTPEPPAARQAGGVSRHFADILDSSEEEIAPLRATLGDGFTLKSRDDEYQLRFRVLDQTDFKVFSPNNQYPASSGIYIPRVRFYFEGQLTRFFQYEVSLQRSIDGVWDLLDGNVNIRFDPRVQLRFGRMLVPYSYDWYDHLEQYFIAPERALFPLNFGIARSAGLEAHGRLFDDRFQYAVGGFDGHLVGLADNNTTRDAVGYLNVQPFRESERFPLLRNLNVGVSGFLGQQVVAQTPLPLRTSLQSSENDEAAQRATSIFLKYNEDAFSLGGRSGSALHLAWYARGFSFEAEWQGSRDHYQREKVREQVSVPVKGSQYTVSYFITGEEVSGRGMVEPLRPFDPARSAWGPGAIELFARYSALSLGDTVFSAGLADPQDWTRSLGMTDIGFNWYLSRYLKIYVDWQHAMYASPVLLNPFTNTHSRENDLFWIRGQLYY